MVEEQKEKSRGCLYYGCLVCLVLVVLIVGLAGFILYKLRNTALEYTDTAPLDLPRVTMDYGEREALNAKLDVFGQTVRQGMDLAQIVLTDREVNVLVSENPGWQAFSGQLFLRFEDGKVAGSVSLPLDKLPLKMAKDRYLNGSGVFDVFMKNSVLIVNIDQMEVKGKQVPEQIMAELRNINLAQEAYNDVQTARTLARIQKLDIRGDRLFVEVAPE